MESIERKVFSKLYGKPCWNAKRGWGTFITFDFGKPHLNVYKPYDVSETFKGKKLRYKSRQAYVRGDWHLWIHCAGWQINNQCEKLARWTSSNERINKALRILDGQTLSKLTIDLKKTETIFEFDLGGQIRVFPYDEELNELWFLYTLSGYVFTLSSDGKYSYSSRNTTSDKEIWKSFRGCDYLR